MGSSVWPVWVPPMDTDEHPKDEGAEPGEVEEPLDLSGAFDAPDIFASIMSPTLRAVDLMYGAGREGWGPGPWEGEPDRDEWMCGSLPCLILRHPELGHLTGYVGVPLDSPLAGMDFADLPIRVNWGLTYGAEGEGGDLRPKGWYWFGFDCAHAGDQVPAIHMMPGEYRSWVFVRERVEHMAADLEGFLKTVQLQIEEGTNEPEQSQSGEVQAVREEDEAGPGGTYS